MCVAGGSVSVEGLCVLTGICQCFAVSLHFNACDVTTQLAPDAPSPGRILTTLMLGPSLPPSVRTGPLPAHGVG